MNARSTTLRYELTNRREDAKSPLYCRRAGQNILNIVTVPANGHSPQQDYGRGSRLFHGSFGREVTLSLVIATLVLSRILQTMRFLT